jgi:hypothetical protein
MHDLLTLFRSHFSQVRHFIILFTTTNEQSSTTMSIHPLLQAQPTCRIVHSKPRGERSGDSGQAHHLDANQHRGQQGRHEALENSGQYPHVQPMRRHNQNPTTQLRMESEAQHLYRITLYVQSSGIIPPSKFVKKNLINSSHSFVVKQVCKLQKCTL